MFCFVLIYYGMILYLNLKKNYFLCTCGTRFQIFSRVAVVHFERGQPRPFLLRNTPIVLFQLVAIIPDL